MKVAPKDIDNFLKNIPKSIKAILLYGPDNGLVTLRTNYLVHSRKLVAEFNYDQVKNTPHIILNNFNSISLFDQKNSKEQIIKIECNNASINEAVSSFLKEHEFNGLLAFYTNELGTDSSLRRFFENDNNVAAIACYQDDQQSIIKIIQQSFRDKQINITADIVSILVNYIPIGDRMLIINEIEKICLFLADRKNLSKEDLSIYLELQGEISFDKLCYDVSLKKIRNSDSLVDKLLNEGHNVIAITRMLIRHFYRILQVKELIENGRNEQQALASLSPPVFFKQLHDFNNSLKLWSISEIKDLLKQLTKIELQSKQYSSPSALLLKNILLTQIKIS